jgi:hypothetical protein
MEKTWDNMAGRRRQSTTHLRIRVATLDPDLSEPELALTVFEHQQRSSCQSSFSPQRGWRRVLDQGRSKPGCQPLVYMPGLIRDTFTLTLLHSATMYFLSDPGVSTGGKGDPVARRAFPLVHSLASAGLADQQLNLFSDLLNDSLHFSKLRGVTKLNHEYNPHHP